MMKRRQRVMPPRMPAARRRYQGSGIAARARAAAKRVVVEMRHHQLRRGCSRMKGSVARMRARPSSMRNPCRRSGDGDAAIAAEIREHVGGTVFSPLLLEELLVEQFCEGGGD